MYRRIKEALSIGDLCPPQPLEVNTGYLAISSEARRHLYEQKRRNMVKHLSHSMQTSKRYYEVMNVIDATEAHHRLSLNKRWSQDDIVKLTN